MAQNLVYNSTLGIREDGKINQITETDQVGNQKVTQATQLDPNNDAIQEYPPETTIVRPTTATTTVAATGAGWARVRVEGGTMGRVEIFDNTAASGTLLFDQTPAAKDVLFAGWIRFNTGFTIRTTAATVLLVEVIQI